MPKKAGSAPSQQFEFDPDQFYFLPAAGFSSEEFLSGIAKPQHDDTQYARVTSAETRMILDGLDEPAHNGSSDPSTTVARTNDQRIDGLLRGVRWSDGAITYSNPDSPADYGTYFAD